MINRPKNSKALLVIIIVLLAANIGGLAYFFLSKPNGENHNGSSERKNGMLSYLKNDIGFSAQQLVVYDTLIAQHKRNMGPMFELLKKEKEKRLRYIAQYGFADTAIASAINKAVSNQQIIETQMLMHLKDIRNICNDQQKIKFDTSIYKIFSKKNGNDRKKRS